MAREIAERLGVPVKYVPFPKPGELADAADTDVWDIGLIGAEPHAPRRSPSPPPMWRSRQRIWFPPARRCKTIADVDKPGVRIAVTARSAYGLWLERNIKHATLVRSDTLASATEKFVRDKLEALAGLRPGLITDITKLPGARILDGQFSAVQQAVGTPAEEHGGRRIPAHFVEEAKPPAWSRG